MTTATAKEKRTVYLDHAALTPIDARALSAMAAYYTGTYGNPSALYDVGRSARTALDDARAAVANAFGCGPTEILFTASGTESDNMAIFGVAQAYGNSPGAPSYDKRGVGGVKGHLITTTIEHHAVLRPAEELEKNGFEVTYLKPDRHGMTLAETLAGALREDTILVSLIYANNEIGTVNPVKQYAKVIREWKAAHGRGVNDPPFLHTDACQATNFLEMDVKKIGVDLMTVNSTKIYGPTGVGALFVRRGVRIRPLIHGGGQENKLRSGTENVAGIVGFVKALELARAEREAEAARLVPLRDYFIGRVTREIPKVVLNGHPTERLPNNVNVSILDIEGEALLLYLNECGISCSTGSACDSQTLDPSHVIVGIGKPYEFAHGSLRFTLGRGTTKEDIDYVLDVLPRVTQILRGISPINIEIDAKEMSTTKAFVGEGLPHFVKKN